MRISVPSMGNRGMDEMVGEHFGRVPTYTIYDTETDDVQVLANTSEHMGGNGYPPELLATAGVNVMVCGGLGRRAIMMFEEMGIRVFVGARGTVREAIESFRSGAQHQQSACGRMGSAV